MRNPLHSRILDVIESNPADQSGWGVRLADLAEAMDMTVPDLLPHLRDIENAGDCIIYDLGPNSQRWGVTSLRPTTT